MGLPSALTGGVVGGVSGALFNPCNPWQSAQYGFLSGAAGGLVGGLLTPLRALPFGGLAVGAASGWTSAYMSTVYSGGSGFYNPFGSGVSTTTSARLWAGTTIGALGGLAGGPWASIAAGLVGGGAAAYISAVGGLFNAARNIFNRSVNTP